MKRATTIKDIAEVAGVSTMTVTRVYGKGYVAPETRKKVEYFAAKLNYRPNLLARGLRGCKTKSIGILWSIGGPHDSQGLIREITFKLSKHGYVSYVADSLNDPQIMKDCLEDYVSRNIDGIIIQEDGDKLRDPEILDLLRRISNVVIGLESDPCKDIPFDYINLDRNKAIYKIMDHLVASGRRNICFLAQKLSPDREKAFMDALESHHLPTANSRIINHSHLEISPDFVSLLVHHHFAYDAVLTASDESAAAVIALLHKYGLSVPHDVAIVGFNDNLMSQFFIPPIASVNRRNHKFSDLAVDILIEKIESKRIAQRIEHLDMQFVKRESAG